MAEAIDRELLLDAVQKTLEDGIRLSAADVAFIESAWGVAADTDLPEMMTRPDDWDAASLVELVFSADAATCRSLLAAIQAADFTTEDADWIVAALRLALPPVTVRLPDGTAAATVSAPEAGIRRYMDSLRITRRLPPSAAPVLAHALPETQRSAALSYLRLSRLTWQPGTVALLRRLFERLGQADDLMALLAVLVEVLESAGGEDAVEAALVGRKRAYFKALCAADRFRESAAHHNMETLMMMGIHSPSISSEDARRQMNLTDRLSMALFGRTDVIAPEAMCVASASLGGDEDLDPLMGLGGFGDACGY